jgi:hypothetical protein
LFTDDGKPNGKAGVDQFGFYRMVLDGGSAGQGEPFGTPVIAST